MTASRRGLYEILITEALASGLRDLDASLKARRLDRGAGARRASQDRRQRVRLVRYGHDAPVPEGEAAEGRLGGAGGAAEA
ncbi:hypothetical protein WME75_16610 [Sorangium sp. So ce1014]|uniref:hypothetical protein n=1 Tax=Sorangium sp. So ce1014 TaxID=3133326 RepID=UPI003F5E5B26